MGLQPPSRTIAAPVTAAEGAHDVVVARVGQDVHLAVKLLHLYIYVCVYKHLELLHLYIYVCVYRHLAVELLHLYIYVCVHKHLELLHLHIYVYTSISP